MGQSSKKTSGFYQRIDMILQKGTKVISKAAAICMIVIALIACVDIVMAKVFHSSIPNGADIIAYLLIPTVYTTVAYIQLHTGLINVDMVESHFPRFLKKCSALISSVLGIGVALFMSICGWKKFTVLLQSMEKSSTSSSAFYTWPFALIYWIGLVLFVIAFIWTAVRVFVPETALAAKEEDGDSN